MAHTLSAMGMIINRSVGRCYTHTHTPSTHSPCQLTPSTYSINPPSLHTSIFFPLSPPLSHPPSHLPSIPPLSHPPPSHPPSLPPPITCPRLDFVRESAGKEAVPHIVPGDLPRLLGNVVDFMKWQAEDTDIQVGRCVVVVVVRLPFIIPPSHISSPSHTLSSQVHSDPLPDELSMTDILIDHDWLREDLFCIGGNAVKYSRETTGIPVVLRVTIENFDRSKTSENKENKYSEKQPTNANSSGKTTANSTNYQKLERGSSSSKGRLSPWVGSGSGTGTGVGVGNELYGSSTTSVGCVKMIKFSMLDSGQAVEAEKLSRFFDRPTHTGTSNLPC